MNEGHDHVLLAIVSTLLHLLPKMEQLMATVADINAKLDTLTSDVQAYIAAHPADGGVATQAELDSISNRIDTITGMVTPPPPLPAA